MIKWTKSDAQYWQTLVFTMIYTKQISLSPHDVDVRRHFLCFATLLPDPAITLRQIQQIKLGC